MKRILLATAIMFLKLHLVWAESRQTHAKPSQTSQTQDAAAFDAFVNYK